MLLSTTSSLIFIDEQTQVTYKLHLVMCMPLRNLGKKEIMRKKHQKSSECKQNKWKSQLQISQADMMRQDEKLNMLCFSKKSLTFHIICFKACCLRFNNFSVVLIQLRMLIIAELKKSLHRETATCISCHKVSCNVDLQHFCCSNNSLSTCSHFAVKVRQLIPH